MRILGGLAQTCLYTSVRQLVNLASYLDMYCTFAKRMRATTTHARVPRIEVVKEIQRQKRLAAKHRHTHHQYHRHSTKIARAQGFKKSRNSKIRYRNCRR